MWNTVSRRAGVRNLSRRASILALMILAACTPPLSFEYLDISCSVGEGQQYYQGETVALDFSITPGRGETERSIVLTEGGLSRSPVFTWEGRTLHIRPLTGWKKGEHYGLSLDGKIPMEDGRTYTARVLRGFIYGLEGNEFTLVSSAMEHDSLVFRFSKTPDVTSFATLFSLNPGMDYYCDFLGAEVRITPKSPWQINTLYTWTIKGIASGDGYLMKREYSGVFSGPGDLEVPYALELCPVDRSLGQPYLWKRGTGLDRNLENGQGIGFIFSKPMDHGSLRSGISFYPSIKGYFEEAGEHAVVFFPEEDYRLETEYRVTLSQLVKDSLGLSLFEEARFYFTSAGRYLELERVTLDSRADSLLPGGVLQDHLLTPSAPPSLGVTIAFSSAIPQANRKGAADAVSLSALFPASALNPALASARWEDGGAVLSLLYENLSPSGAGIDNYYQIKIVSGKQGPVNGAGEYLKEDLWYVFRIY